MTSISDTARRALLEQHGRFPVAYSVAFQPDLLHFGDETGFLSYKMVGKTAFVLADPVAPLDRHGALIDAFLARFHDVSFWQISHATAALLNARGFFVNAFGSETVVDLRSFSFRGPARRSFRTAANRFAASGHSVREVSLAGDMAPKMQAVSDAWRRSKATKSRELRFLVRPVVLDDEPGARKFVLFNGQGEPEGFAFFDPVFEDGQVVGYLSATRRWLPGTDPLAGYLLMRSAIETFQAEGVRELHLGLSPFHLIEDKEFNKNWVTRRAFRFFYTNNLTNRFLYPVRSLSQHKDIYGGEQRLVYVAFNQLPAVLRLLKLLRACRIV
jgi:phosphatidylglycerol lysyltransferase